ncbi:MAG: glycosyltransferase family 4 protein [Acidiferrobacterales bacterium]|jgi:glycosyltransferase involved in cell wall biosynthesis
MNILVLCRSPAKGGLELYVHSVMRWAKAAGHLCVAVVAPSSMLQQRARDLSVPYVTLEPRGTLFPLLAARKLARFIAQHDVDVVHMHWGKDLALAVLAKTLAHRPVRLVYTRQMNITRAKNDPYHRWLYRHVDKIIVISKLLLEQARRLLPIPADRVELLYYGVPDVAAAGSSPCADFLANIGLGQRHLRVALFGRIEHAKGQHLLVEAIARLVTQGLDVGAAIIGHPMDAVYFDRLKQTIRSRRLHGHIAIRSFVDNPMTIMKCFDAIVLATYCETFGLVLIEGMKAGVAVIGTNAGGVPDIIADGVTGLLFEPGDSTGLAGAISRLYRDRAFAEQLAVKGKRSVDTRFSEHRHFERLEAIFAGA